MHQCPRCHYETFHKGNLLNHFNKKKHCLPIHDDISLEKLREKIVVKNAFKIIDKNESKNISSKIQESKTENNKLKCKYCEKELSRLDNLNRHMINCKVKKKQDLENEDIKNIEIKNLKEQIKILYKEVLDLKIKNTESILQNKKLKLNIIELNTQIDTLENSEENIEDKSKYTNKKLSSHKKKNIPLTLRNKIWLNKYGESFNGDCYCCSKQINIINFHCGHIISRKDNGSINENNLRPICPTCNASMGSTNLEEFKKTFFT